jgi:hypothetical protein
MACSRAQKLCILVVDLLDIAVLNRISKQSEKNLAKEDKIGILGLSIP